MKNLLRLKMMNVDAIRLSVSVVMVVAIGFFSSCGRPETIIIPAEGENDSFATDLCRIPMSTIRSLVNRSDGVSDFDLSGSSSISLSIGHNRESLIISQHRNFLIVDAQQGSFVAKRIVDVPSRFRQGRLYPKVERVGNGWMLSDGRRIQNPMGTGRLLLDTNQRYVAGIRNNEPTIGDEQFAIMDLSGGILLSEYQGLPIVLESDDSGLWVLSWEGRCSDAGVLPEVLIRYENKNGSLEEKSKERIPRPQGIQSVAEFDAVDFCPLRNQIVFLEYFIGFSAGPFSKTYIWTYDLNRKSWVQKVRVPNDTQAVFFANRKLADLLVSVSTKK